MFGKAYREGGYDFTSYLLSAEALLKGTNPYTVDTPYPYIYPLFLASVLTPFTLLPYSINNFLWFFINVGSFGFSVYLLLKIYFKMSPSKQVFLFVLFFMVIVLFSPIQIHLLNGQVNFLVILFCTLFIYWNDRNNKLSSLFLAFAISLKIVPLVFLIFLFIEKKYKDILLTIVFSFISVFVLPFLFAGIKTIDYYSYYFDHFIINAFSTNLSDNSIAVYFTLTGFITSFFVSLKSFGIYVQIISAVIILSPIVYLHHRLLKENIFQKNLLLFSLYSLSVLLISPSSQTHHLVFIIPAIFWIIINFYEKIDKEKRWYIFYYMLVFALFWAGNIFKHSPLIFISIITLFIITFIISQKKIRLANEKI